MSGAENRRGFLRGLAALPLIGGGVQLIGAPTAAAEPVTRQLLGSYDDFLFYERRLLLIHMYPDQEERRMMEACYPRLSTPGRFHFPIGRRWDECPQPHERAAVVLSAAGYDWRARPAGRRSFTEPA